jgi:RNA polymerase sigma factor (sigma-70 family)
VTTADTRRAIDAVWRIESPRLIAGPARKVRDVRVAEDLAQDALVAALEQWPESGVPDNSGAWLMAVGKRRAIDHFRRTEIIRRKQEQLGRELETGPQNVEPDLDAAIADDVGGDLRRLVFSSCHPVRSKEARVALTLRLLGGLTTEEIAGAFLVPEPTVAQQIVRAKRTLAEARVPTRAKGSSLVAVGDQWTPHDVGIALEVHQREIFGHRYPFLNTSSRSPEPVIAGPFHEEFGLRLLMYPRAQKRSGPSLNCGSGGPFSLGTGRRTGSGSIWASWPADPRPWP